MTKSELRRSNTQIPHKNKIKSLLAAAATNVGKNHHLRVELVTPEPELMNISSERREPKILPEEGEKGMKLLNLKCSFCHSSNPGCGPLYQDGENVYHECCAVYSPMVYHEDNKLLNVEAEIRRGQKLKCTVCKLSGASIGCCMKSCKKTFHFACAGKAGCFVSGFALRCEAHGREFLKQRYNRLKTNKYQEQIVRVRDILLRKADELQEARGIDDTTEEKKQASLGRQANKKSRKSRMLQRLKSHSGWKLDDAVNISAGSLSRRHETTNTTINKSTAASAAAASSKENNRRGRKRSLPRKYSSDDDDHSQKQKKLHHRSNKKSRRKKGKSAASISLKEKRERVLAQQIALDNNSKLRSSKLPPLKVGAFVDIIERHVPGSFKEGGRARIVRKNANGTYDVKMIVNGGIDKNVARFFISEVDSVQLLEEEEEEDEEEEEAAADDDHDHDGDDATAAALPSPRGAPQKRRRKRRLTRDRSRTDPGFVNGLKVIVIGTRRYMVANIVERSSKGRYQVSDGTFKREVHFSKLYPFSQRLLKEYKARDPTAVFVVDPPPSKKGKNSKQLTTTTTSNMSKKKKGSSYPYSNKKMKKSDVVKDWRERISVGDKVECQDVEGDWLPAELIDVESSSNAHNQSSRSKIKIHYIGYGTKYDEWISRYSERLRRDNAQISFHVIQYEEGDHAAAAAAAPFWKMEALSSLENIFRWQLPEMPPDYITHLLYDKDHRTMCLMKARGDNEEKRVVGGLTYRPFYKFGFAEIVFCAVISHEQVSGCGSQLMNHTKEHLGKDGITHFITYADDGAIGFFRKQGFSKKITLPKAKYLGKIKEYKGGQLMDCKLDPTGVSQLYHGLGDGQNVSGGVYPIGARVEVQFLSNKTETGRKWTRAKILKSKQDGDGKLHYMVHYMGWNSKWDQWTIPEHIRPDLNYKTK